MRTARRKATAPGAPAGCASRRRAAGHLAGARTGGRTELRARGSPPGPGRARGLRRRWAPPPLDLAWARRQRRRRDGAVREGQALLSDLRYSVSQAGLGEGGRHGVGWGGGRRSQGNFVRCGSLPFPPSFPAGRNFIGGVGGWRGRKQRKLVMASTSETCTCLERVSQSLSPWDRIPLDFGNSHRVSRDQEPSGKDPRVPQTPTPLPDFRLKGRETRERCSRSHGCWEQPQD